MLKLPRHVPPAARLAMACWTAVLLHPAWGQLLEEEPFVEQLWQVHDDLPHNHVRAVLQTGDGYVWVATPEGAARYTGVHFGIQFDRFHSGNTPSLPVNACSAMAEDRTGRLWLGLDTGHIAFRGDGAFERMELPEGWPSGPIASMAASPANGIFALSRRGALGRFSIDAPPQLLTSEIPGDPLLLVRQTDGKIWLLSSEGLHPLDPDGSVGAALPGDCAGAARDGGVWVLADQRLRRRHEGRWVQDAGSFPELDVSGSCILESRDGSLFVGTSGQGLLSLSRAPDGWACREVGVVSSDYISDLCEDHEGSIWVATEGSGLVRFGPRRAVTVVVPGWASPAELLSLLGEESGDLWIGSVNDGLFHRDAEGFTRQILPPDLAGVAITCLQRAGNGELWLGTLGRGLWTLDGETCKPHPTWPWGDAVVHCLYTSPSGRVWAGLSDGLAEYRSDRWTRLTDGKVEVEDDVRCLAGDAEGNLWYGCVGHGLVRADDQGIRRYKHEDGLPSDTVYALSAEPDGTLWVGTQGGGLARVREGQVRSVTAQQGIHLDTIGQILDDGRGRLWLAGLGGLVGVEKTPLNRCADGAVKTIRTILLDLKDGFSRTDFVCGNQPAAADTGEGRLWFTAGGGLGTIQPAVVFQKQNRTPPPVVIRGVIANEQEVPLPAIGPAPYLRFEPGTHRLEFRYNALSYIAPRRVRFQYRLQGLDKGWVDAGSDRAVRYARLPPGEYVFQVRGCNNDGVWNYEGASLAFYLAPFFRQTVWFRLLMGVLSAVLVASAAYSLARSRHRRRLALARQREALERERGRIARDMHDEVGAQLTRVAILSRLAQGSPGVEGKLADQLRNITQTSKDSVKRFDEIVWAVNPRNDTLRHFADYLANYAVAYFDQTDVQCVLSIPVSLPDTPLPSAIRHNLVRACEEALGNALRHAEATQVSVKIVADRERMEVRVSDNGKGFARVTDGPEANGLRNMKKRLSDIRGICEIDSVPGQGTTVRMHISLSGVHNHA